MNDLLTCFAPISLEEMSQVRLMNRIDTKYVTDVTHLVELLQAARMDYRVQEIKGRRIAPYHTVYYDTPSLHMYTDHLHGRARREKVRLREYVDSGLSFLEVKQKDNHGRTDKHRIPASDIVSEASKAFLEQQTSFTQADLHPCIENCFERITLVNRRMTERVTIDLGLRFHNLLTEWTCQLQGIVVIEVKRDGRQHSAFVELLRRLRILPAGFSKYCVGMALTDPALPHNLFKPKLRRIGKLAHIRITQSSIESQFN